MKAATVVGVAAAAVCFWFAAESVQAQTATDKLGRGVANTFLGVFEVPNQVFNTYRLETGKQYSTRNRATIRSMSVGVVRGFREGFRRTAHGVWDTVTFLSPGPGGNKFNSRIQPEYITEVPSY